jgi:rRNA maturation RNase YbeY
MNKNWLEIKNQVLGKNYDLSFSYAGSDEMLRLNKIYRKKDYSANVLSFPLSSTEGEILINKNCRKNSGLSFYLFVHSLLHLSGLKHGKKMDEKETEIMKEFYPKEYQKIMANV